jgi:hypothetical protein
MTLPKKSSNFHAFVLYVWAEESDNEPTQWRCRLEEPKTGDSGVVADLPALIQLLQEKVSHKANSELLT